MRLKKRTSGFLGNLPQFFGANYSTERHRSVDAHGTLTTRSNAAQIAAQVALTGSPTMPLKSRFRAVARFEKVAHPGASYEYFRKSQ